jgi:hypothetical protein
VKSPLWRKSTRSTNQGGACVEVSRMTGLIGIRDSKNPALGHISLDVERFTALVRRIKNNEMDV